MGSPWLKGERCRQEGGSERSFGTRGPDGAEDAVSGLSMAWRGHWARPSLVVRLVPHPLRHSDVPAFETQEQAGPVPKPAPGTAPGALAGACSAHVAPGACAAAMPWCFAAWMCKLSTPRLATGPKQHEKVRRHGPEPAPKHGAGQPSAQSPVKFKAGPDNTTSQGI